MCRPKALVGEESQGCLRPESMSVFGAEFALGCLRWPDRKGLAGRKALFACGM